MHKIQPPGVNHVGYTPQDGMTSGGHFLSYLTLHWMELSMAYDSTTFPRTDEACGGGATNATHPSVPRYIAWMVLALPTLAHDKSRTFQLRCLLALIAIIENEERYMMQEMKEHTLARPKGDIMGVEIANERAATVRRIIKRLKAGLKVKDTVEQLAEGPCWVPGPACVLVVIFPISK
ncbi:hypothetical protein OG21DRAFT_1526145 [Imleria badia]|nr:hypothetical protein OG21DRAFT_1526145 [Imleria badia]